MSSNWRFRHTVEWGLSEQQLNHSSTGNSSTYTQFGWVGRLHTALITGLAPGQAVFYRVGDADGGFSGTTSFRTLPADAGSAARPLRVASIADMGYGNLSDDTVARLTELVETGSIDMVIHSGDVSYAVGNTVPFHPPSTNRTANRTAYPTANPTAKPHRQSHGKPHRQRLVVGFAVGCAVGFTGWVGRGIGGRTCCDKPHVSKLFGSNLTNAHPARLPPLSLCLPAGG